MGAWHCTPPFPLPLYPHKVAVEDGGGGADLFGLNGKNVRHHFLGVYGKVVQIRELVEVLDQVFDSFQKVNTISRTMLGPRKPSAKKLDRMR